MDQNCTGADSSLAEARARVARRAPSRPLVPAPRRPPDLLLVTVDALRADASRELMPETRAVFRRCFTFPAARANANFTDLSILSILAGVHSRHARDGHELKVAPGDPARGRLPVPPTLPAALARRGYVTHAIVPLHPFRPYLRFGLNTLENPGRSNVSKAAAAELLARAEAVWQARDRGRPFFLWVHLLDVHAPYLGGTSRAHYDRAVRSIDAPLARLLASVGPEALVVLTADHGEAFGEHGAYTHGNTLYEEELRVPLVLCVPPSTRLGQPRSVAAPVGLIDLAPTLLELTGTRAPYPRQGESLVPLLRGEAELRSPELFAEVWIPYSHKQALVLGRWKWVRDLDREWEALFDLRADPGENRDLARTHPEVLRRLRRAAFSILDDDLDAFRSWRLGAPRGR